MFRYLSFLCLVFYISTAAASDNDYDAKIEASKRYLEAMPVKVMWSDITEKMAATMPKAQKQQFVQSMKQMNLSHLEEIMLDAMAKNFTIKEINALADFYGSPVGKSAMSKFGQFMADVNPAIQAEVRRAISSAN